MTAGEPRISFGIIVLNGEPFIGYCLRALYPHAHQVIVVEGACRGSENVATPGGHSADGTLETIRDFIEHEDHEGKVVLVTAEDHGYPDGFWPGEKDEMSRAYASRATGSYLWQVDVDEFYHDEAIEKVKDLLRNDPGITAMTFRQIQFWGGFRYLVDGWLLRRGAHNFHRLFRWGEGYSYSSHRPPTVKDREGRELRTINWLNAKRTLKEGILLHHYSFVFPAQVADKAQYYMNAAWSQRRDAEWWANDVFMHLADPFSVFSVYRDISWLKRFRGKHPGQILKMISDIGEGRLAVKVRHDSDIEKLLKDPVYIIRRSWYILLNPVSLFYHRLKDFLIKGKKGGR